MAITARSESRSSVIVDLANVFIQGKTSSALVIGRVHPIISRQWIFGNESMSHAPRESRRLSGISSCFFCHRDFHLITSWKKVSLASSRRNPAIVDRLNSRFLAILMALD